MNYNFDPYIQSKFCVSENGQLCIPNESYPIQIFVFNSVREEDGEVFFVYSEKNKKNKHE